MCKPEQGYYVGQNQTNLYTLTKEQYQELYKEVLLFAQIGGVTNDVDKIWEMCGEEFIREFIPAIEAEDKIKVIDGICDSFVVFTQLHHYFMSKPSWEQPQPDCGAITAYTYRVDSVVVESAIKTKYERLVPFIMEYVVGYGEYLAQDYNFNLYKAIKEVNRSNMTKFPSFKSIVARYLHRDARELAAKDCERMSNGKYKDVVATTAYYSETETDNDFHGKEVVVFRENSGNGKIVKHLDFYQEPNFDHCWL